MKTYEKIEKLADNDFKLITGVTREVFYNMLEVLKQKYIKDHEQGGQPGLPAEIRLTLSLEYWREYHSFPPMANDHQIAKSIINKAVLWVEDALSESTEFKLKESLVCVLSKDICAMLDSGYQGVNEYLPNAMIPYKATKKKPLTIKEKAFNIIL